ncbi:MAG: hypothetical protein H6718_30815 [Polyangiaceae bacterium]|nr:hypothetical protein [Polyangiaceae bacterium]
MSNLSLPPEQPTADAVEKPILRLLSGPGVVRFSEPPPQLGGPILLVMPDVERAFVVRRAIRTIWGRDVKVHHLATLDAAVERAQRSEHAINLVDLEPSDQRWVDAVTRLTQAAPGCPTVMLEEGSTDASNQSARRLARSVKHALERASFRMKSSGRIPGPGLVNRHRMLATVTEALERALPSQAQVPLVRVCVGHEDENERFVGESARILSEALMARFVDCLGPSDLGTLMDDGTLVAWARGVHPLEQLRLLVERLRESLSQPFHIQGQSVFVSVTLGTAVGPRDADSALELVDRAYTRV